ncbi:deoxyribose-phosphate aldolase, partial [Patescibacteria group bacterium]|nr:deoxyribose-phosphate aldolase [Patescibacteria group bacterium]
MNLTKENISGRIDHTNVKPDATKKDIIKLCSEAKKYGFRSVCVTSSKVKAVRKLMGKKGVVISVIGFPFGAASTESKIFEAEKAVKDGASEIDMVINIGAVKEKDWDYIKKEISKIAKAIKPVGLKVIMEIGFLTEADLRKACKVAKEAGAAYVKTSTGYGPRKPTVNDIKTMRRAVGKDFKVKASGGTHNFKTAKS